MVYTIDFESHPIVNGAPTKPEPVGVSVKIDSSPSVYYAWGHPTKNNCTKADAAKVLKEVLESDSLIVAHNASFDLRICLEHFGLPFPRSVCDTMIMAYLHDPREDSLGLKELADKYLGMPPDEQTELNNWLTSHGFKPGRDIAKAPGDVVGKYAIGDTDRTYQLYWYYKTLMDTVPRIWDAFNREMQLIPIVIGMEQRGLHLTPDIQKINTKWQGEFELIELQLKAYGGGEEPGKKAFFTALANKGLIDKSKIEYTDKGNPRYGAEFLTKYISDDCLLGLMKRRSKLQKLIGTYVRPFAEKAAKYNGKMYPYYNQTRGEDDYGTRSGRFSSNIQQLPKGALNITKDATAKADDLPNPRRLIVSKPGYSFVKRDFCFSPDTEFLTDDGFKLFDDISPIDKLAYWEPWKINYEQPVRRIDMQYDGCMVNVHGAKSIDALVTVDHDMVLMKDRHQDSYYKCKVHEVPLGDGHKFLPQSGHHDNVVDIGQWKMVLVAAYQADGSLKSASTGRVAFKFSKQRKIDRLIVALNVLGIDYSHEIKRYECDNFKEYNWFVFYAPDWMWKYVSRTHDKTFTREVLTFPKFFCEEVTKWDGAGNIYASTNYQNCNLVNELCTIRGIASQITTSSDARLLHGFQKKDGTDKKQYYEVSMHKLSGTYIKTQSMSAHQYSGRVVCFEMPHGTLVVRRNGKVFVSGNCGQELRVLAHYAEGTMLEAYVNDPKTDIHSFASDLIFKFTGNRLNRTFVKVMNFLCVYGGGAGALSRNLGIDTETAKEMLALHKRAFPEIGALSSELTRISKSGKQIVTWGGRGYWVEEPKVINGKRQEWYYKLLNLLIQGSSADMTKEAMIRYYNHPDRKGEIAVQVHDEIVLEVLDEYIDNDMAILKWAMDDIPGWDVPLMSDGEVGKNLYDMEKYDG